MTYKILFLSLLFSSSIFAQESDAYKVKPSRESLAYRQYKLKVSVPPYGIEKVRSLVSKIKNDSEVLKLSVKDYQALSLREKFTYTMIHAEDYAQNCDVMPPIADEQKKIFGYLEEAFPEYTWSERQRLFLNSNRDSVMSIIKESVTRSKRMGLNYKMAIDEINGKEMIPFIIKTFQADHKDLGLLTLLMLLMKKNEYPSFLTSETYRKIYGPDNNYQAYIVFNQANEDLMISRASNFFNKKN